MPVLFLFPNGEFGADLRSGRQSLVIRQHLRQPLLRPVRIICGTTGFLADVDDHPFLRGAERVVFIRIHLTEVMQPLVIVIDQSEVKIEPVPFQQFAQELNVRLDHVGPGPGGLDIPLANAQVFAHHFFQCQIKGHTVVSNIHVLVVVDPIGLDRHAARDDGRRIWAVMAPLAGKPQKATILLKS